MKSERTEKAAKGNLEASRGWFMRLEERIHLRNTQVQPEAASADIEAVARHPEGLVKIISEDGYTKQIFDVDEIALYWEKIAFKA